MAGESSERQAAELLDAIGDEDCRRLLRILDREGPLSVADVHDRTGIAQSTLYRKMGVLSGTPLVREETHLAEGGRQPTRYRLVADAVTVDLRDEIAVTVAPTSEENDDLVTASD